MSATSPSQAATDRGTKVIGKGIRRPVKRRAASQYLLWMVLSFAASVVFTRVFLQLTGFPQLGNSQLHIAHVLWGGLLLFVATLLPLIWVNRWVYPIVAIVSGVGVGLFIDEVGKFITQDNNYFYPAAAPIIYTFFLFTVLMYLQVRRRTSVDVRGDLYHALDELSEVVDDDFSAGERDAIALRLRQVAQQTDYPNQALLAQELLDFLDSDKLHVIEDRPSLSDRLIAKLSEVESRWFTRWRHKAILVAGLGGFGLYALFNLFAVILAAVANDYLLILSNELIDLGVITTPGGLSWFIIRMTLEGMVGLLLVIAAIQLITGRERSGL